jgi:hypothetical protein
VLPEAFFWEGVLPISFFVLVRVFVGLLPSSYVPVLFLSHCIKALGFPHFCFCVRGDFSVTSIRCLMKCL